MDVDPIQSGAPNEPSADLTQREDPAQGWRRKRRILTPTMRRRRRLRSLVILILYAGFVMIAPIADWLVLFPSTEPILMAGMDRREVAVPNRRPVEVFESRFNVGSGTEPSMYMLVFNGNADRAEGAIYYAQNQLHGRSTEVWAMNYPGYGRSAGPARLSAIAPAAIATFDALRAKAGGKPVYLVGVSIGSTAALYVARHREVAGLLLVNPPPLRQLILQRHGWWNLWMLAGPVALSIPSELNSVANASEVKAPAVFIVGDADEVVPPKYHDLVTGAYAGEKKVIHLPEAGHNDLPSGEQVDDVRQALDWLYSQSK